MYSAHAVQAYLNERFDEIVDCRHHLHQYPEIGLELPQTAAYIESELKKYGVDEIHKDFGCSALLAVIHGKTKSGLAFARIWMRCRLKKKAACNTHQ